MEGSTTERAGWVVAIVPHVLGDCMRTMVGCAMRYVKLPTFWRPEVLDQMIAAGEVPALTVQCLDCGAMGDYDDWTAKDHYKGRLCPSCGHYMGERIR